MDTRRPNPQHIMFSVALLLVLTGVGLLLLTTDRTQSPRDLWPLLFVAAGLFIGYVTLVRHGTAKSVFLGLFLSSVATLRLVMGLFKVPLSDYWPLFAVLGGLCMLPAGFFATRKAKPGFVVPALSFMLLGGFFSIFSFGFSSMSFSAFIVRWWPLLFVAAGLSLFVLWFLTRSKPSGSKGSAP